MAKSELSDTYPIFPSRFIHAAILLAGIAGFTIGAHNAFLIGFDFSLGSGYYAYIQTHGHIQLLGWVGLFIIGVSIYFIPRLAHYKIIIKQRLNWIFFLLTIGIGIKYIFNSALPYYINQDSSIIIASMSIFSSFLIALGILTYLSIFVQIAYFMRKQNLSSVRDIRIFMLTMIFGWLIFGLTQFILSVQMLYNNQSILLPHWNIFIVDVFIFWIIIPICFGVGIRALPLFMRLPAIRWNTLNYSKIYLGIVTLYFCLKYMYHVLDDGQWILPLIYPIGLTKFLLILWFIYKINIVIQLKPPWTDALKDEWKPHKKEARDQYPDYGEFGRFEILIKSSFLWLTIASVLGIYLNMALWFKIPTELSIDGIRHALLLGFTTPLIIGMGVRMIPGMSGKRRLMNPNLVLWIGLLINMAAILRIIPMILPSSIIEMIPNGYNLIMSFFGLSGVIGVIGIWFFYYVMFPVLKS